MGHAVNACTKYHTILYVVQSESTHWEQNVLNITSVTGRGGKRYISWLLTAKLGSVKGLSNLMMTVAIDVLCAGDKSITAGYLH